MKLQATFAVSLLALTTLGVDKLQLARDGKALAKIVVAEKATAAARFGAMDLKWHLDKITGANFEIVSESKFTNHESQTALHPSLPIFVGPSRLTKTDVATLRAQQSVVDIRHEAMELIGFDATNYGEVGFKEAEPGVIHYRGLPGMFDEQGTMYAVYEFLEKDCGVRWVDASRFGTMLPKNPNLSVAIGRTVREPFMSYRGGTIEVGSDPVLWRSGTPEREAIHTLAYGSTKAGVVRDALRLFQARQRVGGSKAYANHSFYWWYDRFWRERCPTFIEKRPECFAQGYSGDPPQLCFHHPRVLEQTVIDIRAYLDRGGYTNKYTCIGGLGYLWGKNRYCLEPQDNSSFCKCPRCQPWYEPDRRAENSAHSTYWFKFVHDVAVQIKQSHPEAKIATLAYMSHEGLPGRGIRLPDNVEVYFCVSGNRENPRGALCRAQLERMRQWHEAYPEMKLGLWLYDGFPLEFAHNGNFQCVPGYFAHEAAKQFRFFKDMNASVGIFNCGMTGEVCQYLTYTLMREPMADIDILLDQYFAQYGAAAKPLRAFYDLVEERYCNLKYRPLGVNDRSTKSFWECRCPPEVMRQLTAYMEAAKRLAVTPETQARVKLFELGQYQWMKRGADAYAERISAPMPNWTAVRIGAAEGEIAKVDWERIPLIQVPLYVRGSNQERRDLITVEARFAHDGQWFYLELDQIRDLKKLKISGTINPCDDWELLVSRQRAQPYRCYFSSPESRMQGASWGEVNWRQGVGSQESCKDPAYFARVKSTLVQPNRWIQRFAFPLDRFLDQPVKPGETFYLNPVTVLNSAAGGTSPYSIFSAVSHSTVHTCDRSAAVKLAP